MQGMLLPKAVQYCWSLAAAANYGVLLLLL
jgi:hypothetical protein